MSEHITLTKLEILKIARELVINEYIDQRAQDHNAWIAESNHLWQTRRLKLPYPKFPPYPTEVDILRRAEKLNTFLSIENQEPTDNQPIQNDTVIDVSTKELKEVESSAKTNYVSDPSIYEEIINNQNQPKDTPEISKSTLEKLKSTLGFK